MNSLLRHKNLIYNCKQVLLEHICPLVSHLRRRCMVNISEMFSVSKCALSVFFSLFCIGGEVCSFAQNEPLFSNSFQMPLASNPGAAGRSGMLDVTAAMRQQWVGFDGAPTQFYLAADAELPFLKAFHGLAITVLQDKYGPVTALNLTAAYSYHIYLDKALLGLGARFGVYNVDFSTSDLYTSPADLPDGYHQESDQLLQGGDESKAAFDVGIGAYYQSPMAYASLAVQHLTAPDIEMASGLAYKVRPTMVIAAGRLWAKDVNVRSLEPRFELRTDFSTMQLEMTLNVNIRQRVWFGSGVRLQDAIPISLGVHFKNGLDIAYTYDINISKLRRYSSGSHDVAVRYSFDLRRDKPKTTYKSVRIL